ESLSRAFAHALCGVAGINLELGDRAYDYGIDGTFHPVSDGSTLIETGFPVDFQLKSTVNWEEAGDEIIYDLEANAYNKLVSRHPNGVPYILVLLCLPRARDQWLVSTTQEMALRHCCYWIKLTGEPTKNVRSQRIFIPRSNLLTPDGL